MLANDIRKIAMVCGLLLLTGCATSAKLPLCPAIAANSYTTPSKGKYINQYIVEQARARRLSIAILSPYAAEFSGDQYDIKWMQDNYKYMLCAFNPLLEIDDRNTYLSCMSHADEWVALVRAAEPEKLMLTQTTFHENCTTSPYSFSTSRHRSRAK